MIITITQKINLCAVVRQKASEFESKYHLTPNSVVLPLFLRDHLISNFRDFRDTSITEDGHFFFMGFHVNWTMVANTECITVFHAIL